MIHDQNRKTLAAAAFATVLSFSSASAFAGEDVDWLAIFYVWGADITIDVRDQSIGADRDVFGPDNSPWLPFLMRGSRLTASN